MSNPFPIRLTSLETIILDHRLTVPDALADALEEEFPNAEGNITDIADVLFLRDWAKAISINENIAKAVLADAVNGSTYYALSITEYELNAIYRAGVSLANKVENFTNIKTIRRNWTCGK